MTGKRADIGYGGELAARIRKVVANDDSAEAVDIASELRFGSKMRYGEVYEVFKSATGGSLTMSDFDDLMSEA